MSRPKAPRLAKQPTLDTVDAVARSAHLWIEWLDHLDQLPADERQALTGGLVSGLCELMELDSEVQELAAYAVALLAQGDAEPLVQARQMAGGYPDAPRLQAIHQRGRDEAYSIVQMLRSE